LDEYVSEPLALCVAHQFTASDARRNSLSLSLLVPFPAERMAMWLVSPRVNSRKTTMHRCLTQQLDSWLKA
jgi:hypothetical protein